MEDSKYCYPDSEVLINKLNIQSADELFEVEKQLTFIRLQELQTNPIRGKFDFTHLKKIHEYIFQDIYEWAGKIRTVEIGKGNLFCTTACIQSYADSVFGRFYSQCKSNKADRVKFVKVLADNYADLNALHPFREGNGRTQREFTRLVCLECGYAFDLSCTTHNEMLDASIRSFNYGDTSLLYNIFLRAVIPLEEYEAIDEFSIKILSSDDLSLNASDKYYYYEYKESTEIAKYNSLYREKIKHWNEAIKTEMYLMGTGHIGPRLYLCVLMEKESRFVTCFEFGKSNSDKLKKQVIEKAGIIEKPSSSRIVSAFFGSLTQECLYQNTIKNPDIIKAKVSDWINYYNFDRIHSSLGYKTPYEIFNSLHSK